MPNKVALILEIEHDIAIYIDCKHLLSGDTAFHSGTALTLLRALGHIVLVVCMPAGSHARLVGTDDPQDFWRIVQEEGIVVVNDHLCPPETLTPLTF
jgi:hypothetical protein